MLKVTLPKKHLLILIRQTYRRIMPEKPDPFEITPTELDAITDQATEDHTGKSVDHGSLALNIEAMQKRVAYHEENIRRLNAGPLGETDPEQCAQIMATERAELKKCSEMLDSFHEMEKQRN